MPKVRRKQFSELQLFEGNEARQFGRLALLRKTVLKPSFPREQYVNEDEDDHFGELVIACTDDGEVVGGALGEEYPESQACLLAYIAVREDLRNQGIGKELMSVITSKWLANGLRWYVEIDDPRHSARHGFNPLYGDPEARLRFYRDFGVRAVPVPFFQPSLDPEKGREARARHLLLGVLFPVGVQSPISVPGVEVECFLREYFAACEGEADRDGDSELSRLFESCNVDQLALVDLDAMGLCQIPDLSM